MNGTPLNTSSLLYKFICQIFNTLPAFSQSFLITIFPIFKPLIPFTLDTPNNCFYLALSSYLNLSLKELETLILKKFSNNVPFQFYPILGLTCYQMLEFCNHFNISLIFSFDNFYFKTHNVVLNSKFSFHLTAGHVELKPFVISPSHQKISSFNSFNSLFITSLFSVPFGNSYQFSWIISQIYEHSFLFFHGIKLFYTSINLIHFLTLAFCIGLPIPVLIPIIIFSLSTANSIHSIWTFQNNSLFHLLFKPFSYFIDLSSLISLDCIIKFFSPIHGNSFLNSFFNLISKIIYFVRLPLSISIFSLSIFLFTHPTHFFETHFFNDFHSEPINFFYSHFLSIFDFLTPYAIFSYSSISTILNFRALFS